MVPMGRVRLTGWLAALLLSGLIAGCTSFPAGPELPAGDGDGLLLIIHGSGGSADGWPRRLEDAITETYGSRPSWDIHRLEWATLAEDRLAAPGNGRALGARLAEQLTEPLAGGSGYRIIHLIGHSVGAHVMYGLSSRYRELATDADTTLHQTYLDPFTPRGVLLWRFGESRFGQNADFSESFVTTDDPAFMTNSYLEHAYNIDLTSSFPSSGEPDDVSAHDWPVAYYIQAVSSGESWFANAPYLYPELLTSSGERAAFYQRLRLEFPAGEVQRPVD